jgi:hypothetical protein
MHYMVNIEKDLPSGKSKLSQTMAMIDKGQYFTINRGRQYGKTTMLNMLRLAMTGKKVVINFSFEGREAFFVSQEILAEGLRRLIFAELKRNQPELANIFENTISGPFALEDLADNISTLCATSKQDVVLLIDEVDKASSYDVFASFLGKLRDMYLERSVTDTPTFKSIILAGVHDIKNLKRKIRPESEHVYNSPWNIAMQFDVDMSFSAPEIATMLEEYEADHHSGMDIKAISEELREWTGGYPFLVSRLCQLIDEKLDQDWTMAGIEKAVKLLISEQNTLFDDMVKNMEMYPDIYHFTYALLILGEEKRESLLDPIIQRGLMFSFYRIADGKVLIANQIFAKVLTDYFLSKDDTTEKNNVNITGVFKNDVVRNGRFDMELAIRKFSEHYNEIFTQKDIGFWEKYARLVFLTYLKPLINGEGFYHLESQFTDLRRMDIVVDYGKNQFIIELKLWHGEAYEEEAYKQLTDYLHSRTGGKSSAPTGWLVCFDLRKDKKPRTGWIEKHGCKIFETVL